MLIRTLLAVAVLATPLTSNAATLDLTQVLEGTAKLVKTVDTASSSFQTHFRFWFSHRHRDRHHQSDATTTRSKPARPGPAVPEPGAALLFALGALAVGLGIRRRH